MFSTFFNLIFGLVALIVAITIHEFSHAWTAEHLGDPTPRLQGRLTLNPLPHIDLFGTILLPIILALSGTGFMIGWAKPVQFDPFNLRNPRRDSALISIAGPVSNILLAIVCSFILRLPLPLIISALIAQILVMNVVLAIFNLVPIHPLDGFKIVEGVLPEEQAHEWHQLERFGMIFLIFLLFPIFGGVAPIQRVISPVINFFLNIFLPATPLL
ncbi:MAG: site-2 protease family protein [Candidatus Gottesmanbacteria bacterium]|nr:site-2 protease family protein [Candidatus Gottesmanbacteria bacterium]